MTDIPAEHAIDACPACSTGVPCRVVTRRHARYWDNYRSDPATWGPVILADALADRDGLPDPAHAPARPPARPGVLAEWDALPEAAREAARSCPRKRLGRVPGPCGCEATYCRGGPLDGQIVGRLDCGRCALAASTPTTPA